MNQMKYVFHPNSIKKLILLKKLFLFGKESKQNIFVQFT